MNANNLFSLFREYIYSDNLSLWLLNPYAMLRPCLSVHDFPLDQGSQTQQA